MTLIEHAIFTSAQTDRCDGYQIVSASSGICEEDVKNLSVWGPSHGSLIDNRRDASSTNFHQLPSGAYCISQTEAAGPEYSGRRGFRVYTHSLIVPSDVIARFANNPFSIIRAATAKGAMEVCQEIPKKLEPFELVGGSYAVDSALLMQIVEDVKTDRLAEFIQAAIESERLVIAGRFAEELIALLFNCLPVECRTNFSFTTGLKCSSRRSFRLGVAPAHKARRRRIQNRYGVTFFDLSDAPSDKPDVGGWSRFIFQVIETGRTSFLAKKLSTGRSKMEENDLSALGLVLLAEMDNAGSTTTGRYGDVLDPKQPSIDLGSYGQLDKLEKLELPTEAGAVH